MVLIGSKENRAEGEPGGPSPRRFQFRLATMFIVTTLIAVASAGFAKGSIGGALGALLGAWITLVGGICIWAVVRERSAVSLLAVATGIICFLLGAAFWILSVW